MTDSTQRATAPNCMACRHFFITYEAGHPYGCRAMSFKSREMPSRAVQINSGMPCQAFSAKPVKKRKK